jgi:5-oxopent-3-ene-1,2,5-tricarboxylate decarboxylase/2-hydroxyhepta-2,4-diene-1,7-dioate isomerase
MDFRAAPMNQPRHVPALLAICGRPKPLEGFVDPLALEVTIDGITTAASGIDWDVPAIGTVYGTALNYRRQLADLDTTFHQPPHGTPPRAPVLFLKPRNTWLAAGRPVPLPTDVEAVEVGATLGIVLGRDARRVTQDAALEVIAGYTIVNDVTVPHASFFRPPLRYKCRDGFCPIGPWIAPRGAVPDVSALVLRAYVNGELRLEHSLADLHRGLTQLVEDVTKFMTLRAGDVLTVGVPPGAPLARAGDVMSVEIEGIGRLENPLVAEAELGSGAPS